MSAEKPVAAPHRPSAGYPPALAEGLLPIREVARVTGVNPVTLRAWERRYGLIVPQRTAKGHRLYSAEQVARIQAILAWLERGVAVSQVRGLLRSAQPASTQTTSQWQQTREELLQAIGKLAERRLDDCFNRELALYPAHTLCQHLLLPLFDELQLRWRKQFGAQTERVFFYSWLRSKLGARLYHNNRQHHGAPLLLVNLSELPMEPGLWLSAWLASSADCPVQVFDWPIPPAELALAIEQIRPRALLLYSNQALNTAQLPRWLTGHHCPCLIIGATVCIRRTELHVLTTQNNAVHMAEGPLEALATLTRLGLLDRT
ncbi:MerR family transcriptional regulator [Pseudomonas sp. SJZ079]|uniref:MerR family transcriptional regulator n=1 Tax=Pseudomonas sp. SJZ079 TaxID=2572887 RepID=UPI00119AF332|nr:MerR family transcriptional regulator [Pseudomonas sp. SJZ079]TWC28500.1 MerR family transcriptional regulator [Pseudomonas sp. SJZ079]